MMFLTVFKYATISDCCVNRWSSFRSIVFKVELHVNTIIAQLSGLIILPVFSFLIFIYLIGILLLVAVTQHRC